MPEYETIEIGHNETEIGELFQFMDRVGVRRFVEVGVHAGGLARLIMAHDWTPQHFYYLGLEINPGVIDDRVVQMAGARIWPADAHLSEIVSRVSMWVQQHLAPVLIYCDGGDKPLELSLYARIVRRGDFIGVHDYGRYPGAEISPEAATEILGTACWEFQPMARAWPDIRFAIWRRK